MLDKAEDPEKLISLMIQEMEDTLIESRRLALLPWQRAKEPTTDGGGALSLQELEERRAWRSARAATTCKEALVERRRYADRAYSFEKELHEMNALIQQYQEDIKQLEEKLRAPGKAAAACATARPCPEEDKGAGRHPPNGQHRAVLKFEEFENRIERMEAAAELVNFGESRPWRPSLMISWLTTRSKRTTNAEVLFTERGAGTTV